LKTTDELLLLQEKHLAYKAVLNVQEEEMKDRQAHRMGLECVDTLRFTEHSYFFFFVKTVTEVNKNPFFIV
jgi:hypothetical protein